MSELSAAAREVLHNVPWLAMLGPSALDEVAAAGDAVHFAPGQRMIGELEIGDDFYLLLEGQARATVAAGQATPLEVGTLGAGQSCGELALLTRELRSATVTATTQVEALRLHRVDFEALIARHPQIAVHFAREMAARLGDTDRALDALLGGNGAAPDARRLSGVFTAVTPERGSLVRAWRELVASRTQDLPFLALAAFLITWIGIRVIVWGFERAGVDLFSLLRTAYLSGIVLVIGSTATSLLRFSPRARRAVAVAYGIGFALIFNEISVFLAFDTFYIDMTTRDPDMSFSVEALYRRTESRWAVALAVAALLQATYLRRFYRRVLFILVTRLRGLVTRGGA